MGDLFSTESSARKIGLAAAVALGILGVTVFGLGRFNFFDSRCFILTEVRFLHGLSLRDPVFYRGSEIGVVERIGRPQHGAEDVPLRLRVRCSAFENIALDAGVRIEPLGTLGSYQAVILPGLEPPPEDFPGKAKVLHELTETEHVLRAVSDVLDGVAETSRAKASESELNRLREENRRLQEELEQLKGAGAKSAPQ